MTYVRSMYCRGTHTHKKQRQLVLSLARLATLAAFMHNGQDQCGPARRYKSQHLSAVHVDSAHAVECRRAMLRGVTEATSYNCTIGWPAGCEAERQLLLPCCSDPFAPLPPFLQALLQTMLSS